MFHRLTAWFPPPEIAQQALIFSFETWVESPWNTSFLFFIAQSVSHTWTGLSRHIQELAMIKPTDIPLSFPPLLPIPFTILYIAPYTLVPPLHRPRKQVDKGAYATDYPEHEKEADDMRGLSTPDTKE